MKKHVYIFSIILTLISCSKDNELTEKEYAIIEINEATNINPNSLTLNAEIILYGKQEILDYGFLYSSSGYNPNQISLIDEFPIENDQFSFKITNEFIPDRNYKVMAYIQHTDFIVITNKINVTIPDDD
jgi:hypothetical protein